MSLKALHLVFIVASIVLSLGFGAWSVNEFSKGEPKVNLYFGIGSFMAAVALVFYHPSKEISQGARDSKDGKHLEEVGKRRRIFKRMRRIGIRVATAIGAQHFDCNLRRHWPLHDGLGFGRDV